jgi:DnaJ-class molecular chaperone
MNKRENRKAKSAKKVLFASSPVYIPRKNSRSDHKHPSPQKGTVVSLLFGQFSVQIPNNYDDAAVRRFGSFPRSDQSSDVQILKRPVSSILETEFSGSSFGKTNVTVQTCSICLGSGHLARSCFSPTRCKNCYNYGHLARWCLTRCNSKWAKWGQFVDGPMLL